MRGRGDLIALLVHALPAPGRAGLTELRIRQPLATLAALGEVELVMSWSWISTISQGTLRVMHSVRRPITTCAGNGCWPIMPAGRPNGIARCAQTARP